MSVTLNQFLRANDLDVNGFKANLDVMEIAIHDLVTLEDKELKYVCADIRLNLFVFFHVFKYYFKLYRRFAVKNLGFGTKSNMFRKFINGVKSLPKKMSAKTKKTRLNLTDTDESDDSSGML